MFEKKINRFLRKLNKNETLKPQSEVFQKPAKIIEAGLYIKKLKNVFETSRRKSFCN